jgi:hypothetical protein
MRSVAEAAPKDALAVVDDLVMRGHDLRNFCRDLMSHVRDLLVVKVAGDAAEGLDAGDAERRELMLAARDFSESDLVRFFHSLTETERILREGAHPRYQLEIGLVKLIEMRRLAPLGTIIERLNALEEALRTGKAPVAATTPGTSSAPPAGGTTGGGAPGRGSGYAGGGASSSGGKGMPTASRASATADYEAGREDPAAAQSPTLPYQRLTTPRSPARRRDRPRTLSRRTRLCGGHPAVGSAAVGRTAGGLRSPAQTGAATVAPEQRHDARVTRAARAARAARLRRSAHHVNFRRGRRHRRAHQDGTRRSPQAHSSPSRSKARARSPSRARSCT